MKERNIKILKIIGICFLFLSALPITAIYSLLIARSIEDGGYTIFDLRFYFVLLILAEIYYFWCIPIILLIASIIISIKKKTLWAKILRNIHIINLVAGVIFIICSEKPNKITAKEMETNYIEHKSDIEALARYADSLSVHYPRFYISIDDEKTYPTGILNQRIEGLMNKSNIIAFYSEYTGNDSTAAQIRLIYRKIYIKSGGSYSYSLTLNADKTQKINIENPVDIKYNDSVMFRGLSSDFESVDFSDHEEFVKKLEARKKQGKK